MMIGDIRFTPREITVIALWLEHGDIGRVAKVLNFSRQRAHQIISTFVPKWNRYRRLNSNYTGVRYLETNKVAIKHVFDEVILPKFNLEDEIRIIKNGNNPKTT